jgi:hypothetical protein
MGPGIPRKFLEFEQQLLPLGGFFGTSITTRITSSPPVPVQDGYPFALHHELLAGLCPAGG